MKMIIVLIVLCISSNINNIENFVRVSYKDHAVFKRILRLNPDADTEWGSIESQPVKIGEMTVKVGIK